LTGQRVLVSVVIPATRSRWLAEALDSVWQQEVEDLEVVIVDDGLPEGLDQSLAQHPQVRVVRGYQKGTALARNLGRAASSGEYIAVLDDDDRWLPGKLLCQLEALSAAPDAALSHTGFEVIDEDGAVVSPGWARPLDLNHVLTSHASWIHSTTVWRRSCVDAVGGYSARFTRADDLDLILKVLGRWPTLFQDEVFAQYRVHSARTSSPTSYRQTFRAIS
jgi:glycosyltransferase involved in cell wall biosynthesis